METQTEVPHEISNGSQAHVIVLPDICSIKKKSLHFKIGELEWNHAIDLQAAICCRKRMAN